jgi:toxin ParE1/3/4
MARLIWTEPALHDLDAIADYIALDKPQAAKELVQRVFQHVEQLITQPESGSVPRELKRSRYRQIVEPPCRIFYRYDGKQVYILFVMRGEMRFRKFQLTKRDVKPLKRRNITS